MEDGVPEESEKEVGVKEEHGAVRAEEKDVCVVNVLKIAARVADVSHIIKEEVEKDVRVVNVQKNVVRVANVSGGIKEEVGGIN